MNKYLSIKQSLLKRKEIIIFCSILFIASLTRILFLDSIPGGLNQDEAFIAYEVFSLLTTGMDSAGNSLPVYFLTWGAGSIVLYSYFTLPFFSHLQ